VGQSAVETMGAVDFDAATSTLTFKGVKVSDPGLIGMDKYRLRASSGLPFFGVCPGVAVPPLTVFCCVLCVPWCRGSTPYRVLLCSVAYCRLSDRRHEPGGKHSRGWGMVIKAGAP
jgi:hypothetical protein